ncbi:hypothetical protein [Pseudorhizobium flavum]|uniref:Uncharacterized protein n=1 Tax=Pseudorhizobium flavum TaxID=1335061 RepID=A0A7X0DGD9_9HYPH|nr:hypothetical protein [Pseudorhizobium flavum]MBB6182074.1 hypothetical protein [Pseudorhizobium flavum]
MAEDIMNLQPWRRARLRLRRSQPSFTYGGQYLTYFINGNILTATEISGGDKFIENLIIGEKASPIS